jgi:hypothetical protein
MSPGRLHFHSESLQEASVEEGMTWQPWKPSVKNGSWLVAHGRARLAAKEPAWKKITSNGRFDAAMALWRSKFFFCCGKSHRFSSSR